jgi:hypothetical protein
MTGECYHNQLFSISIETFLHELALNYDLPDFSFQITGMSYQHPGKAESFVLLTVES